MMKQRKFLIWYLFFHINHLIANALWNMGKMCKVITDFSCSRCNKRMVIFIHDYYSIFLTSFSDNTNVAHHSCTNAYFSCVATFLDMIKYHRGCMFNMVCYHFLHWTWTMKLISFTKVKAQPSLCQRQKNNADFWRKQDLSNLVADFTISAHILLPSSSLQAQQLWYVLTNRFCYIWQI